MKLFIDDTRIPSDVGYVNEEWCIVRNYEQFKAIVYAIVPDEISFDHDLHDYNNDGSENTGLTCAKYLVELDTNCTYFHKDFVFRVHSMNPVGKENIEEYINCYIRVKYDERT